ncbi:MAG: LysM peptidoglycan-binding domain-containing protein, partial [Nitrospirae bacterium]|nr:LysM peptidoglycan-binding domain-containing protein [Nitrospirota bacterium]
SKIAQKYNTSPEKIKEWNRLTDGRLKPGDRLYIFTSLDSPAFF